MVNEEPQITVSVRPESGVVEGRQANELKLLGVNIEDGDFADLRPDHVTIARSTLTRCNFQRIRLKSGSLGSGSSATEYRECSFDSSVMEKILPGRAVFISCSFRNVKIRGVNFLESQFIDCVFTGELKHVVFDADSWGEPLEDGKSAFEYRNNDFTEASFVDVAFRGGIDLDSQRLPHGPRYLLIKNASGALSEALATVERWPDKASRDATRVRLDVLSRNVKRKQKDVFVEKEFLFEGLPQELSTVLVNILSK